MHSPNIIDRVGRNRWGSISQECWCVMHETWVKGKDFRIYDIKKSKTFTKPELNSWYRKNIITKNTNYVCTACNTAAGKLLKANCEEIKEKEQDEDFYKQTPINKELETMVDNLLNKLSNSDPNSDFLWKMGTINICHCIQDCQQKHLWRWERNF